MEIRIEPHTSQRAAERGATITEIEDVVLNGIDLIARTGRFARYKVYAYDGVWMGNRYPHKYVKVIYSKDGDVAVTVTVVVRYGFWEEAG